MEPVTMFAIERSGASRRDAPRVIMTVMQLTTAPRQTGGRNVTDLRISRPLAIAGVAFGLLLTFGLDRATGSAPVQHLYYLPIILAAFSLRWIGGLAASVLAIVLYHLANPALLTLDYHEPDFVQMALFIGVGVVTSRLRANARRLHAIAMTDDLTGLHNLRSFERQLSAMIRATRARGGSLSLLVLDLDRLKSLNDTYGHLTGAEAVRTVGHVLESGLPPDAVACRYGGDEFVVGIPGRSQADVLAIADRLCRAVNETAPTLAGKYFPEGTLSISVGVAHRRWAADSPELRPDDQAGESLFRAADAALYDAKSRGRNQVSAAAASPAPLARARG
jgi:diguanylate cyclase (GGDEF)-like protein